MMHVNFNKPIKFLLVLLFLLVAGCSSTPKESLSVGDQLPGMADQDAYAENYPHARNRLRFNSKPHVHHDTVWDRLLSLYSLPEFDNERIDREIDWYLAHPASLAIIQQRAEPYLHHILDEVEAKNIPGELALLPVVESAFVPDAYSSAAASGLWQFIPSTGEEYGLQQNAWYDGRRDVYASTQAATTYLKELSENFDGDWLLALASYNCGKNKVRRSMERNEERNLPTDYWSLDLPEETLNYVPKLLAIAKIFANAEDYNIHLQYIPNKPYFEAVHLRAPLDLRKAALLANTPYDKFKKLNPGFNRSCMAPQGPHRLLIPVDKVQTFKSNLAQLPYDEWVDTKQLFEEVRPVYSRRENKAEESRRQDRQETPSLAATARYRVRAGETLSTIATRTHTTIAALRQANHIKGNTVRYGTTLQVPSSNNSRVLAAAAEPFAIKTTKSALSGNQVYAVKKGDTFWNIAQRFSVSPKEIAEWNKITLKTALVPGRKLTIKSINQQLASASPAIRLIHYTVNKGDTLTQIARKFNVSVGDLRKSNADTLVKGIRPGQKLKVILSSHSST